MKIMAQSGYGPGDKLMEGVTNNLIDGVIWGGKDIIPDKIFDLSQELLQKKADIEILFDPQFYVCLNANSPNAKLGKLIDWDYFKTYRRGQLELSPAIDKVLESVYTTILPLPLTTIIAPNIYISKSFDSIEGVIAKNFIKTTKTSFSQTGDKRKVYATLSVSKTALLQKTEFEEFLNDITVLENPPDGFYILVGTDFAGADEELYHSEIISAWMTLNYALSENGFEVINGCSDLFSPLLGCAGAYAGATGWWSNLRTFSMERFVSERSGGRLPIVKYLSIPLLSRIPHTALNHYNTIYPDKILNNGLFDLEYLSEEPERKKEVLQTWEALGILNKELIDNDIQKSLENIIVHITKATGIIKQLNRFGASIDDEYLNCLLEGISSFRNKIELS